MRNERLRNLLGNIDPVALLFRLLCLHRVQDALFHTPSKSGNMTTLAVAGRTAQLLQRLNVELLI